jgi:ABC-type multidrug transport system ATPase subunit
MNDVIVVSDLVKDYGSSRAVDGLSFRVSRGEVFAILGPNGAGKTTTVEILEGHRERTSGEVRVLGFDPAIGGREYRERIGIVLQEAGFDEDFTVQELVRMYASLYPRRRDPDEVIEAVGLAEKAKSKTKTLSGGQRRRLDLALGVVGAPELLFLDEPTTGFDPTARRRAWDLIASLRGHGTTILLTTHYMEEAQALADRVAVVAAGRNVAEGTPSELIANEMAGLIRFTLPDGIVLDELPLPGASAEGSMAVLQTVDPVRDLSVLTAWALDRGVVLPDLTVVRPTLEDVYLRLTGAVGVDV